MKQLSTTLLLILATFCCSGQNISSIQGTWVYNKTTVDNKDVEIEHRPDTIIINNNFYQQMIWLKNETPYRQTGVIILKRDKLILTQRTTSTSDQYKKPSDIYFKFKLKGKILLVSNAALIGENINEPSLMLHYKRIEMK